jgi:hypothetical protein
MFRSSRLGTMTASLFKMLAGLQTKGLDTSKMFGTINHIGPGTSRSVICKQTYPRSKYNPHQGARECARRRTA